MRREMWALVGGLFFASCCGSSWCSDPYGKATLGCCKSCSRSVTHGNAKKHVTISCGKTFVRPGVIACDLKNDSGADMVLVMYSIWFTCANGAKGSFPWTGTDALEGKGTVHQEYKLSEKTDNHRECDRIVYLNTTLEQAIWDSS